jgi:Na+/H+-dicarboxylate symporter
MTSLSIRIFAGLLLGLVGGVVWAAGPLPGLHGILAVAQPIGHLWLDALTMTIVPLVFGLLVTGIVAAAGAASDDRIAARALAWFAVLLVGACAIGAVTAGLFLQAWPLPLDAAALRQGGGAAPALGSVGDWFIGLIPVNPIKAAADTAMAPLVVFALLFGFAVTRIDPPLRASLTTLFDALVQAMLVLVRWVLWVAPLGVLALAFVVGARMGTAAAGALVHYVVLVSTACLATTALAYAVAAAVGGISPLTFARAALSSQVVALSTQSSLASLPAMIATSGALRTSEAAAGVVLPLAVSLFRAASAAANVAVAVYLGHLYGVSLSAPVLVVGVLVAAAVSLAAVGLPAQVSFFTTIGPVCLAMGVPIEALPLLLAVETIPDIFRTVGNVTADLAVTRIVGRGGAPETAAAA